VGQRWAGERWDSFHGVLRNDLWQLGRRVVFWQVGDSAPQAPTAPKPAHTRVRTAPHLHARVWHVVASVVPRGRPRLRRGRGIRVKGLRVLRF
jgi:hypothetical protein